MTHTAHAAVVARQGQGFLRVEIGGYWSVEGFAEVVSAVDRAYTCAASLGYLRDHTSDVRFYSRTVVNQLDMAGAGYYRVEVDRSVREHVERQAVLVSGRLQLVRAIYESPGLLEVAGQLNPLKLVKDFLDFISTWRRENTTREGMRMAYGLRLLETIEDPALREQLATGLVGDFLGSTEVLAARQVEKLPTEDVPRVELIGNVEVREE